MNGSRSPAAGWVAVILAVGIATAINAITFASLYVAVFHKSDVSGGLSTNAATLLTTAFGGIIGVLGSYIGYRAAASSTMSGPPASPPPGVQTDADTES